MKKPKTTIKKQFNRVKVRISKAKYRKQLGAIIFAVVLVGCGMLAYNYQYNRYLKKPASADKTEIKKILATNDPEERIRIYRQLLERVGPAEGQEMLLNSGLPFNGTTHLLNHTTGLYIYDTYGLEGIVYCKDYFLGSCYHGLLLSALSGHAEEDKASIQKIVDFCKRDAPTTLQQCVHGVGHAYLPANGYKNVDVALQECENLSAIVSGFDPWSCYDGVFMENVWALHSGGVSPDRWIKEDDDRYPCNYPGIKPQYLGPCWLNQPQLLEPRYKGSLQKIDALCITVESINARELCYNAVSRQVHGGSGGNVDAILRDCALLNSDWQLYCQATNASYGLAIGDKTLPYALCAKIQEPAKAGCYKKLIGNLHHYLRTASERASACESIYDQDIEYKKECRNKN